MKLHKGALVLEDNHPGLPPSWFFRSTGPPAKRRHALSHPRLSPGGRGLAPFLDDMPPVAWVRRPRGDGRHCCWLALSPAPDDPGTAYAARVMGEPPEYLLDEVLGDISFAAHAELQADVMRLLRKAKARAALLIAAADIRGAWPVEKVTHAVTRWRMRRWPLPSIGCSATPPARARSRSPIRRSRQSLRLCRAGHGQAGRLRAQLFERCRPDRPL